MAEWSEAPQHEVRYCSDGGSTPPWTFYYLNFLSNFYQTFRANSSFWGVLGSKNRFSLEGQYYKEHFKLGPIDVLMCALSEN